MRHILVHEYFGVDFDLIWQVIIVDLPILKEKVLNVIKQLINNLVGYIFNALLNSSGFRLSPSIFQLSPLFKLIPQLR